MTKRPYIWHATKFDPEGRKFIRPWTISMGKPKDADDYVRVAGTLEEAMEKALKLVPKEVP